MIYLIVLAYCTKSLNTIKVNKERILKSMAVMDWPCFFVVCKMERAIEYWVCM